MEIRILGNYTEAALYLLLHFNDGEWCFVSFFYFIIIIIIKAHADPQHPCWYPRDPFILIAENKLLQPCSITLTLLTKPERAGTEKRDVIASAADSGLAALGLPFLLPSSLPAPTMPSPYHGTVWSAFIRQGVICRAKRSKYETFCCLHLFLQQAPTPNQPGLIETPMIKCH